MHRLVTSRVSWILLLLWVSGGVWLWAQSPTQAPERRGRSDQARRNRAATVPKLPVAWVPGPGDATLMFVGVKVNRAQQFEATMATLKQVLSSSTNPIRQKQRASWRVYRPVEMFNGAFLYLFVLAPPMPGADYSVASLLAEALPEDRKILATYLGALSGQQSMLSCATVLEMAPSTQGLTAVELPAPDPNAPSDEPTPDARTFTGDLGLVLMDIRPDVQSEFVATLSRLKGVMATSTDAKLRQLARGWRVLGPATPAQPVSTPATPAVRRGTSVEPDPVPMLFLIDPPVPGADYSVSTLLSNAFPAETGMLFRTYRGAFDQGAVWLNYTLVADFSQ